MCTQETDRRRVERGGLARALGMALLLAVLAGCASTAKTVLSMREIDCAMCGTNAMEALEKQPGVDKMAFDRRSAELTIHYDPDKIEPRALAKVAGEAAGVRVLIGEGKGTYLKMQGWPATADVQLIKSPKATLEPVKGKVTIFDFYAKWCGPCRQVDAELRKMAEAGANIAVRKIDIGDWGTAMADAHMKGIAELPYVRIHGLDGALVDTIVGLDLPRMRARIAAAGAPAVEPAKTP